jgi:restriction system protein
MYKRQDVPKSPARIWVIRAGKRGEAHGLFLREKIIALADSGMGDLTKIERVREAFYAAYRRAHPDDTKIGSAGIGGKFFRFLDEVTVGDLVVYPVFKQKTIYIGTVLSDYAFDMTSYFPHRRLVRWERVISNAELSQALKYELGAARTFFEVKNNAKELRSMIAAGTGSRLVSKAKTA